MSSNVIFSSQPATVQVQENQKNNINKDVDENKIKIIPYNAAQQIFMVSMMSIGYILGATLIGGRGPNHSDKQMQIVFCGLGASLCALIAGDRICRIWNKAANRKD